jgi:hypothetical protein
MASPDQYKVYKDPATKLKVYRDRIARAEKELDKRRPAAADAFKRYRNDPREDTVSPGGHQVAVPDGIGVVDTMYSSLTAVEVDVQVTPHAGSRDQARATQQALSNEARIIKVNERVAPAVKDAILVDAGFVKTAYEYADQVMEVDRDPEHIAADARGLIQAASLAGEKVPTPDEIASVVPATEEQTVVLKDRIVVDYVPWDMMLWDPDVKRWEDVGWVAQKSVVPLEDVTENPAFKAYAEKNKGQSKKLEKLKGDSSTDRDGKWVEAAGDYITLYEVYDLRAGTVCTITKNADFILDERPNTFALFPDLEDRNPFSRYVERTDPEKVTGIGDMRVIMPSLHELDLYRSRLALYLDRSVPKLVGPEGGLTDAGKAALESREWGAYVELTKSTNGQEVRPLEVPQLPQEMFNVPDKIQGSILEATGTNEILRGLFSDHRTSATEVNAVGQASGVRQAEKQNGLEAFYHSIFKRVLVLMQVFYDQERVVRLVEHEGDVQWKWSNQDIVLGADLEVSLTPKEPNTLESRQQRAFQWFNLLAPAAVQGGPIDLSKMTLWALQESGFRMEDIRSFVKTDEQQQQAQQAAMQQAAQGAAAQAQGAAAGQAAGAPADAGGGLPAPVASSLGSSLVRPITPADANNEQTIFTP